MKEIAVGLFAYGQDQGATQKIEELALAGKKSIIWLLEKVDNIGDKLIIVAPSNERLNLITKIFSEEGLQSFDGLVDDSNKMISMCLRAFSKLNPEDSLVVIPTFSPLIPIEVLELLVDLLEGRDAVFIRDRSGKVYKYLFSIVVSEGQWAFRVANIEHGDNLEIPGYLKRTMTISWEAMSIIDPLRLSYFRLRTKSDISIGEKLLLRTKGS